MLWLWLAGGSGRMWFWSQRPWRPSASPGRSAAGKLQRRHLPTHHLRGLRSLSALRLPLTSLINFKTSLPLSPLSDRDTLAYRSLTLGKFPNVFPQRVRWIHGYNSFGVVRLK